MKEMALITYQGCQQRVKLLNIADLNLSGGAIQFWFS